MPRSSRDQRLPTSTARIKPIFESRCIACHSCYNAPCQLNLQSYSGAARGATSRNVYDAERPHSVAPTRVDIDATTPSAWREKGFHDVLGAGDADRSMLFRLTRLRGEHASLQPRKQAADSQVCVADATGIADSAAEFGMPYGLPPLSSAQIAALQAWIERGAPGPSSASRPERAAIPETLRGEVQTWEQFLNDLNPRQQLVSRYLYEHLFLATPAFREQHAEHRSRQPSALLPAGAVTNGLRQRHRGDRDPPSDRCARHARGVLLSATGDGRDRRKNAHSL